MKTLKEINKQVEDKRLAFIETKDTKLKEKIIEEIKAIKNEFELDNLSDIAEDLKIHKYVKDICEKEMNELIKNKAQHADSIHNAYTDLMTAKAMIGNYEGMITKNKQVIDQLVTALKGSMLKPEEKKS